MLMAWAAFGDTLIVSDLVGLAVAGAGVLLVYGLGLRKAAKPSRETAIRSR